MMASVSGSWYYYAVIALQIICALHVLRTRSDHYWLWIIIFMPVIGCIVYVIIHHRSLSGGVRIPVNIRIPMIEALNDKRIEKDFRRSDTLENRISFAQVLTNRGDYAGALALLRDALTGPLRNDITLLFTCARAHYANGQIGEAIAVLERAETVRNNEKLKQRCLLLAMCHEAQGDAARADEKYRAAQGGYVDEEARARYGLFLLKGGRTAEAAAMFTRIIDSAETAPWAYRREQRTWIGIARENLKARDRGPGGA